MDNHRAAMWCWLQEIGNRSDLRIVHVDEHYDTAGSNVDQWNLDTTNVGKLDLNEYLSIGYKDPAISVPAIRWDNYLSNFLEIYEDRIVDLWCATHRVGTKPKGFIEEIEARDLPQMLENAIEGENPVILNLDLDFFFFRFDDGYRPLYSDNFVAEVFDLVSRALNSDNVCVVTVALSPECCGGWEPAAELAERLCRTVGLQFSVPN